MKSTSPSLFPFVFWVFIIISVLIREYIWFNFTYFPRIGEVVRVKDVLRIDNFGYLTKYKLLFTNISVKDVENIKISPEKTGSAVYLPVMAIGILENRVTGDKFSDLIFHKASISTSGSRLNSLQAGVLKLYIVSDYLSGIFVNHLAILYGADESALLSGLTIGRLVGISTQFLDDLRKSGLLHLAAASGYNVSLVLAFVSAVAVMIKPRGINLLFVIFCLTLYSFISGLSASIVRAAIMGMVGFSVRMIFGSRRSAGRIFLLTAAGMVLIFPVWLFDIGFQLSVAATAGMIWILPSLQRLTWLSWVKGAAESTAAAISTWPILVWHFGWEKTSWVGILTNIPAAVLVGPLLSLGMISVLTSLVWSGGAQAVAILVKPWLWGMMGIIEAGAKVNEFIIGSLGS